MINTKILMWGEGDETSPNVLWALRFYNIVSSTLEIIKNKEGRVTTKIQKHDKA